VLSPVAPAPITIFDCVRLTQTEHPSSPLRARTAPPKGPGLAPAMPDGRPHIVKPPLAAWLIALASWSEGHVSARTAVLPSLLAAIGVVLLTYWLGRRLFGASAGVAAGLTVATMVGIYTMAHSPMPDM